MGQSGDSMWGQVCTEVARAGQPGSPYSGPLFADDERDRLAEEWLTARHSPEWYIGDATGAEWKMAYAAADAQLTSRGRS